MAKKSKARSEQHPIDWAQTAIGRCKDLIQGYEFLKYALNTAHQNLQREGSAVAQGCSDAARDATGDWRRLAEHIEARPNTWSECISEVEKANADNLKTVRVGRWMATTAVQAVEFLAEELRDQVVAVLDWLPGPAPIWGHTYFVSRLRELEQLRETVEDIDEQIGVWTLDELDRLYTHVEHESVRHSNFVREQERQLAEAEARERQLKLLESLSHNGGKKAPKMPRAANGKPGRRPDPAHEKHADHANKLKTAGNTWKEIAEGVNEKFKLAGGDAYDDKSIRSQHRYFYPPPKKKAAVKR